MPYTVSLVDCTDTMDDKPQVQSILQGWFGQAANHHPQRSPAVVEWNNSPTNAANLVIYFVRNQQRSILPGIPGFHAPDNWGAAGGLTFIPHYGANYRPGWLHGSEVYVNEWDNPFDKAMCAFHEAMHNQLRVDNSMHAEMRNYGAGIAAERPPSGTSPNEDNLRRVGGLMDMKFDQYLGGYERSHRRRH